MLKIPSQKVIWTKSKCNRLGKQKTNKQENVKSNDWKSMESRDSANIEENHIKNQELFFFPILGPQAQRHKKAKGHTKINI